MNKKELADLKKNFSDQCGFFTFNNVLRAYVDADKNIVFKEHKLCGLLPAEDQEIIIQTLKKALGGSLGKNLVEYSFPNSAYEEDMPQAILSKTLKTKLLDDEQNDIFLQNITRNIEYTSTFAILSAHCTYTLFNRDKNEEKMEIADTDFNFLITAICSVELGDDVLIFDDEKQSIYKKHNTDRLISRVPSDAFMFPVLTGGGADVNSVLYYTAKPKQPNKSVVNQVLGCEFTFTANDEKEAFCKVLSDVLGDDLDYTIITQVNEKIKEEIKEHRFDEQPATIDDITLRDILYDVGVEDAKLDVIHKSYEETVGKKPLTATNLVSTRTVVATPEITVNISKDATDKVRTSVIGGRRCLIIDLDDPNITVNGLPTTVGMPTADSKEE